MDQTNLNRNRQYDWSKLCTGIRGNEIVECVRQALETALVVTP